MNSPLTDTSVAIDKPLTWPRVEDGDATLLVSMSDHSKVRLKGSNKTIFRVYQDWLYQNPRKHLDGGIKEDGKWQSRWKNRLFANPRLRHTVCSIQGIFCLITHGRDWQHTNSEVEQQAGDFFSVSYTATRPTCHWRQKYCSRIEFQIDFWNRGAFDELANDTYNA